MFYDPLNPFGFQHTLSFRGNVVEITSAPLFKEEQIRFKPLSDHYFGRYLRFTRLIIKLIISSFLQHKSDDIHFYENNQFSRRKTWIFIFVRTKLAKVPL